MRLGIQLHGLTIASGTAYAHAAVQSMKILYGSSMTDHVPIAMTLEVESLPELSHEVNSGCSAYLDWSKLTNDDLSSYMKTDVALSNICTPRDAIMCSDVGCKDISHSKSLCDMYDCIVEALYESSKSWCRYTGKRNNNKPGWNKCVAAHHTAAKVYFLAWVQAGRPRNGPVLEYRKINNARYKYAIRYIDKHEQTMRADALADKLLCNNVVGFWKEVRALNRTNTTLPGVIEGFFWE